MLNAGRKSNASSPRSFTMNILAKLFVGVFVGALHPHEGLEVDHVARFQIALVAPDGVGEGEEVRVNVPRRARLVPEVEAVGAGGKARDVRLEEDVPVWLRD